MLHRISTTAALMLVAHLPSYGQMQRPSVENYAPIAVLRKPIRPITDPKLVSADQAKIQDNDLVIGITLGGQARAYPINQLTGPMREIINDTLSGTAIAATW